MIPIINDHIVSRDESKRMLSLQSAILDLQHRQAAQLNEAALYRTSVTKWHSNEQRMQQSILDDQSIILRSLDAIERHWQDQIAARTRDRYTGSDADTDWTAIHQSNPLLPPRRPSATTQP